MKRRSPSPCKGPAPRAEDAVHVFSLRHGDEDLLVFSAAVESAPPALTPAQFAVAQALARGASNAEIARERGTSLRTVANQVAAIFARLGVGSRRQVAIVMARYSRDF
jgi:DNA-binding NarL/FixJ family response regulator